MTAYPFFLRILYTTIRQKGEYGGIGTLWLVYPITRFAHPPSSWDSRFVASHISPFIFLSFLVTAIYLIFIITDRAGILPDAYICALTDKLMAQFLASGYFFGCFRPAIDVAVILHILPRSTYGLYTADMPAAFYLIWVSTCDHTAGIYASS